MEIDLNGKVAIVTGSSRGIGRATAIFLARAGAKIAICYKNNLEKALEVQKIIREENSIIVGGDLANESDVRKLASEAMKTFGKIDILVNNAGEILRPGDWKSDLETWKKTIDINLTSAWLVTREVAPIMLEQKSGSIINVVSVYGFLGAGPVLAYTSAKAGMITMTKSFAKELAPHIRVNSVAPSNVWTDMTEGAGKDLIKYFQDQTPLKRLADPEELAKPIAFLASDLASYITGEMLVVDGGYSLK